MSDRLVKVLLEREWLTRAELCYHACRGFDDEYLQIAKDMGLEYFQRTRTHKLERIGRAYWSMFQSIQDIVLKETDNPVARKLRVILSDAHREVQRSIVTLSKMNELDKVTKEHDSQLRKVVMEECAKICEEIYESDEIDERLVGASIAADKIREKM